MAEIKFLGYPDPLAPEAEKASHAYGSKFLQTLYNEWDGNGGSLTSLRNIRWQSARDHAGGKQSVLKYRRQTRTNFLYEPKTNGV